MKLPPLFLFLFLTGSLFAQNMDTPLSCATEEVMNLFYQTHPEKLVEQKDLEKAIYERMTTGLHTPPPPYTLPVVVHVIHQNGPENISDDQIELAIEQMNEAFSHTGYYGNKGEGFNTQIQFCLASQDPDGNPSNGITRHVSPFTNMTLETEDIAMKDIARWEPFDYINIYVVNGINSTSVGPGVLGYAFFPTSHGLPEDGIVCEAGFFGTTPEENTVLIHEMGHYLNLFHTFQGGCGNDDCLLDGDRVCDTPPDQATFTSCLNNSCATDTDDASGNNPFTTDVDDLTDNYMDYSPYDCYHAFTPGQAERMYAAIDLVRFSLLDSDGCSSLCPTPIAIDFTPSSTEIFAGETVNFINNSTGSTTYEWSVDGVAFATTEDASFTFNQIGTFEVELLATNANLLCEEELSVIIEVNCPIIPNFTVSSLSVTEGQPFSATNASQNATAFEWYINGVLISTDVDLDFNFTNAGTYTILLVATDGFCADETNVVVTVTQSDPCPFPPCAEICDNGLDDDGDGFIDCFDQECECSNGDDCSGEAPPADDFDAGLEWRSTEEGASSLATPLVANLDPQNGSMPEIIVPRGDQNVPNGVTTTLLFFNGDGSNQAAPVELNVQGGMAIRPVSTPAIGDIDGDGVPEIIIVCGDARVRAYTNYDPTANPPMELWATSSTEVIEKRATPSLADFDGDGISEILVGNDVLQFDLTNPAAPQLTTVLDGDGDYGQVCWFFSSQVVNGLSNSTAADVLTVNDCGGDPDCDGIEVLGGTHIYSVDLDPFDGDGLQIKIQRDLNALAPGFNFADGMTATADVNLDGVLDVVVGATRDYVEMGMYAWDKNGLIGFFPYPPPAPGEIENFAGMPTISNLYDDTEDGYAQDFPEIVCVSAYRMTAFNLNAQSANPAEPYHWSILTNETAGYTSSTIFDFNGDGRGEICYRDDEDFRIIYGGPEPLPPGVNAADRNWYSLPCFSPTTGESPIVADCDLDGEAEIIFTGKINATSVLANTRTNLWVVGSDSQPWTSCRPVWNQYAYFGVNVNDDLSIPIQQQLHHLEFPALGSGNRPFNQFTCQMPVLNNDFSPLFPVPDATVFVDSSACDGDSIRVWVTVCNQGSNGLPADTPISFYDGDPRLVNAPAIGLPFLLPTAILQDACESFEWTVPAVYNTPIFVVVNDNQTLPLPYSPFSDFPSTEVTECDYENNFAEFTELSTPLPPLDLGPDVELCANSVVVLDAGGPYDNYEWQDGETGQTYTAFGPGTYWVTVQSGCSAPISDTIEIILNQTATFELGPDITLCLGESVELTAPGFDEVTWFPEEGLDCTDCPTVNASPTEATTYYATGQNGDCFFADSIQITVGNIDLEIEVAQNGCDTEATLTANASGSGGFDYVWSNGATADEIIITESGIYEVLVTSQTALCEIAGTAEVDLSSLVVDAETTPVICTNDATGAINLTPASGEPPFDFSWENGAVSEDLNNLTSGQYAVTVTDATGCSTELNFDIPTLSNFSVELLGPSLVAPDEFFQIAAIVSPSGAVLTDITWQPDGFPSELIINPSTTEETLFTITLTDTAGCTATDELFVRIENSIYFPNVINPNSEIRENGGFTGFGSQGVSVIRSLKVFDRWGGQVYEGKNLAPNDTSAGWDGTARGEPVNQGVYVYLAEVEFADGEVMQVKGDVLVLR